MVDSCCQSKLVELRLLHQTNHGRCWLVEDRLEPWVDYCVFLVPWSLFAVILSILDRSYSLILSQAVGSFRY